MAKSPKLIKPSMPPGPYLAAAFFCETVIQDKTDGSMSAIRIVDTVTVTLPRGTPAEVPSESHRIPIELSGILAFKTGGAPGEYTIRTELVSPTGKKAEPNIFKSLLSDLPNGGVNIMLKTTFLVKEGGHFHFDVYMNDKFITRMPLQVNILRVDL